MFVVRMAFGRSQSPSVSNLNGSHSFISLSSPCFFPPFVLKDIKHGSRLRGLAVLLVCGIIPPIILEKGKIKEALHTAKGRHNNFIMASARESSREN